MVTLKRPRPTQTILQCRNNLPAVIQVSLFCILLILVGVWFWMLPSMSGSNGNIPMSHAEEIQLRSERVNRPNRPASVQFSPEQHDENNNNNKHTAAACAISSLSQLTEQELQPRADDSRYMRTPPIGGKVSLVCCTTTAGPLAIVAHSSWAPLGARRFLEMVESEYFNAGIPLFRCIKNFLCQFGLSSDVSKAQDFKDTIEDDPNWLPEGKDYRTNNKGVSRFAMGYLAYAGAGKHSRNKQLIVALKANGPLAGGSPWEVPWGEVVGPESFQTLSKIYTGYGENGPKQGRLMKEGVTDAMREEFPKLDYIERCELLDERVQEEPFAEPGNVY